MTTIPSVGQPSLSESPLATPSRLLDATVDQLESLVNEVDRFLNEFAGRARTLSESLAQDAGHNDQAAWQEKREVVEASLHQQVEMLAEAWQQLESERRELSSKLIAAEAAGERQAQRASVAVTDPGLQPQRMVPTRTAMAPRPNAPVVATLPAACTGLLSDNTCQKRSAQQEFETLRLEIQSRRSSK